MAQDIPAEDPVLYYMPIAARGEVSRLIAHVGGLNMRLELECTEQLKKEAGSPSSLPILVHGPLKITQSSAIVAYLLSAAPKYRSLTCVQHAKDMHIHGIFEDVIQGLAKVILDPRMGKDETYDAPKMITDHMDKWMPIIEYILPASGFVNGLSYPTAADFAMVVMLEGVTPFVGCYHIANNYDPLKNAPKLKALYEKTRAYPEVKQFLDSSTTLKGNPFGLP